MTEKELRQNFVDIACSYHDYNEADGSHKKIIDIYNTIKPLPVGYKLKYTDAWCAGFVSAMAHRCGITDIVFPECGCDRMIRLYQNAGRWEEDDNYRPQPGDIIFYDWQDSGSGDNRGSSDHVGIVVSITDYTMMVIEGNVSNSVWYRYISVGAKYIRGYGLPDFTSKADSAEISVTPVAPDAGHAAAECIISLPELCEGDEGPSVRALQLLLIGAGCSVGWYGADSEFGPATKKAVLKFQKKHGFKQTGIADKETWVALLK